MLRRWSRTKGLKQVFTSLADGHMGHSQWVTVYSAPKSHGADFPGCVENPQQRFLTCISARKEILDGDGKVLSLGERLEICAKVLECKPTRQPEAHAACHIPVSCDDPLSLFFVVVADLTTAGIWLAASVLIKAFIILFVAFLYKEREDGNMYNGSRIEWLLLVIVLALQGVPSMFDMLQPFGTVPLLCQLIKKVQPELQARMWLCLGFVCIDLMQPVLLTILSIYVALYLSNSDMLGALVNVCMLAFIGSLDTALVKRFMQWKHGSSGHRISLAFLDVVYYLPGACCSPESAFWDCSHTSRQDVLRTLRSEDTSLDMKWEALMSGRRGLGILGTWWKAHPSAGAREHPTVQSVVLDVSLFSWADTQLMDESTGWLLDGASDFQWLYEISQLDRKALLKAFPTRVDRFILSGAELQLSHWGLGVEHAKALATMLTRSPDLKLLRLNGNDIGNEGLKALAATIAKCDTLTLLDLRSCNIGDEGARALMDALLSNPHAVSNCTHLGCNPISKALQDEMRQKIGSADHCQEAQRGVTFNDG